MEKFTSEQLSALASAFSHFPESSSASTVDYDTGKLINLLREKEVLEVCNASTEQWTLVNDIDIALGAVVKDLVLNNQIELAIQEYYRLVQRIENETSGNLYIYAKQGALSVISLYHYKKGEWDKAIDYTVECICLNDYLIEQGMNSLCLRVYEQNKNISRVLLRAGRIEEGYQLIRNLFDYLFNGTNNGLYGSTLKHDEFWKKSFLIRETYAYEMFCMIVEDMLRFNIDAPEFLFPQEWFDPLEFEVDNINRQVIYNYMYLLKSLKNNDFEDFVDSFIYYMSEEISVYYEIFKLSLLVETSKVLHRSGTGEKLDALSKVNDFISEKLKTSQKLNEFALNLYINGSLTPHLN